MKSYYRVMLGKGSIHAADCFAGNWIGAGFIYNHDLTGKLPESWRTFNKAFTASSHPRWQSRPGFSEPLPKNWTGC